MLLLAITLSAAAEEPSNAQMVRRRPRATSLVLHDIMATAPADQQPQLHYWFARCLERIDLLHAAQRHYVIAARDGAQQWRQPSLIRLVELARLIGDFADLEVLLPGIPPVDFPAEVSGELYLHLGISLVGAGEFSSARAALEQVSGHSPAYFEAQLRLAVLLAETGERTAARDVLVHLHRLRPAGSRLERRSQRDVQALGLLSLGRLYFAADRHEEARILYSLQPTDSPWLARAAVEGGWAALWEGDTAAALQGGQQGAALGFHPEADLLAVGATLQRWGCEGVRLQVTDFIARHQPIHDELTRLTAREPAEAWQHLLTDEDTTLPVGFYARVLQDRHLAGAIFRLDRIEREAVIVAQQREEWLESVGQRLLAELAEDTAALEERAGLRLLERAGRIEEELEALLTEAADIQTGCRTP